jgi:hypothetical protein
MGSSSSLSADSPTIFLVTADSQASDARPRRGARVRRAAALIALALGLAGLAVSGAGLATQLLPRQFTPAQQQQIENWEIASRWQRLPAGQIFPASVPYQLSSSLLQDSTGLSVDALRIAIAPQSGCGAGVTTSAAAVLRRDGCKAVLRATYVDSTRSYVTTVGVAVLPSHAAAAQASWSLSQPQLAAARNAATGRLAAGILVVRYRGTAAAMYDYSRQVSASYARGPYLIMYAAGYADSRPRVTVTGDRYSDAEMTTLAKGVAHSVAATLAARPASPHCPGAPGC